MTSRKSVSFSRKTLLHVFNKSVRYASGMRQKNLPNPSQIPDKHFSDYYVATNGHTDMASTGKAISLQAWTGPEGSRNLRFPDFKTVRL